MTDKLKIGDKVRVLRKQPITPESAVGKTFTVKRIGGNPEYGLNVPGAAGAHGLWWYDASDLELVQDPRKSARILTEKVLINAIPCRKILGFEGILVRGELPKKYLEGTPRFAFCTNTINHTQIWDGARFVGGATMAEPGHVDLDVPGDKWIKGTCNIMFRGDVWPETHFQEYLAWLKRAGSRLAKIRKQEKAAWSGKETVEI